MAIFKTGIYEVVNITNGKRYVGSAADLKARLRDHLKNLRKGKHHNRHLQFAWNKYGEGSFEFKVILYCDKANLLFYEQRALDFYNILYNLAPTAGSQLGWVMPEETKQNISRANKGKSRLQPPFTKEHRANLSKAFTGRIVSDETKKKQSDAHKRRKRKPHSDEARQNISLAKMGSIPWNKGKTGVYSDEVLARKRESSTGRTHSDETKAEMSRVRKGREPWNKGKTGIFSPEALEEISRTSKERRHSPETRQKMSDSAKVAHSRRKQNQNKVVRYAY
jgi:group I intron endonuclease